MERMVSRCAMVSLGTKLDQKTWQSTSESDAHLGPQASTPRWGGSLRIVCLILAPQFLDDRLPRDNDWSHKGKTALMAMSEVAHSKGLRVDTTLDQTDTGRKGLFVQLGIQQL
jgi:hypothetical protein